MNTQPKHPKKKKNERKIKNNSLSNSVSLNHTPLTMLDMSNHLVNSSTQMSNVSQQNRDNRGMIEPVQEETKKNDPTYTSLAYPPTSSYSRTTLQEPCSASQPILDPSERYWKHVYYTMTLLTYLQTLFNCIVIILSLYVLLKMIIYIRADFLLKIKEHIYKLVQKSQLCIEKYQKNQCHSSTRVPALEKSCNEWELYPFSLNIPLNVYRNEFLLINLDFMVLIYIVKIAAEVAAEIVNSFVDNISYKTLMFFLIFIFGSLILTNITLWLSPRHQRDKIFHPQHIAQSTTVQPLNNFLSNNIQHIFRCLDIEKEI
ncbi:Di-sulfide bridge nucleocytoplasmic transport domain-containing protein [Spinellus fusiger]|nr:Di-sulfide bridge nucleocytoplasmic transport domain-containing protein [Spinellus fusiger]